MRFIIYLVFFYFVFKIVKYLISLFVGEGSNAKQSTVSNTKKEKQKIKQEDIIDAEFEEIDNAQSEKREN